MAPPTGTALRDVFGWTLADLADRDPRILVLDGDVGSSTGVGPFEAAHPDRFLQMGVAEQNMLGVAAGLRRSGSSRSSARSRASRSPGRSIRSGC